MPWGKAHERSTRFQSRRRTGARAVRVRLSRNRAFRVVRRYRAACRGRRLTRFVERLHRRRPTGWSGSNPVFPPSAAEPRAARAASPALRPDRRLNQSDLTCDIRPPIAPATSYGPPAGRDCPGGIGSPRIVLVCPVPARKRSGAAATSVADAANANRKTNRRRSGRAKGIRVASLRWCRSATGIERGSLRKGNSRRSGVENFL